MMKAQGFNMLGTIPRALAARVAIVLAIVSFIAWLAVTPSATDERFRTLRDLITSGQIGDESDGNMERFQTMVRQALTIAGIRDQVVVNTLPVPGKLHFYLTDSRVAAFTRCTEGNAVYDANLDAVFIDRSLFNPSELGRVGKALHWEQWAPSRFAFTNTFMMLIVLHELGHRKLHRFQRGIFDGSTEGRHREIEADRFAANALHQAYVKDLITADSEVLGELAQAGLGDHLEPGQQLVASVLFASAQMSVGLLFSRGTYSSLYEDASHPSFGDRVRRISEIFANLAGDDATLASYLQYFRAVSGRIDALRNDALLEVHSDSPLAAAQFDDDGLVFVSRSWAAYRVPFSSLAEVGSLKAIRPVMLGTIGSFGPDVLMDHIWSVAGEGTFVSVDGGVFQIDETKVSPRSDIAAQLRASGHFVDLSGGEPNEANVTESDSELVITRGAATFHLKWKDLIDRVRLSGNVSHPKSGSIFPIGDALCIFIHKQDGAIVGNLEVRSAASTRYVEFKIGENIDAYAKPVAMLLDGTIHYFLVGKTDLHSKVFVWEIFSDRPAELRAEYAPLLAGLSDLPFSGQNVPVIVSRVRVAPPNTIIITLPGDSVIQYDPISRTISPVFHPGTSINVDTSHRGFVAFSAFNGYKIFVRRP